MIFLLDYDLDTGKIKQRLAVSDSQASLYPNAMQVPQNIYEKQPERSMKVIVETGQLVEKAKVTITPEAMTFPADLTELDVNFTGLIQDGKVKVGTALLDITMAAPVLTLTSDTVRDFTIYMDDDVHWSEVVRVKAV